MFLLLYLFAGPKSPWAQEPQWPELVLDPQDRVLVIAPHPDDEVLGCAGVIQKAVAKNIPVRIVFLTNGDSNQWSFLVYRKHPVVMPGAVEKMGLVRHDEAVEAAKILGLSMDDLIFLGYPDFGTINMWYARWGNRPPFKSLLTRKTAVPYKNALRYAAPYKGEEILRDLETVLDKFNPTKIFISHPADHNGDHLAAYLFTRVALWDIIGLSQIKNVVEVQYNDLFSPEKRPNIDFLNVFSGEKVNKTQNQPEIYPYLIHQLDWPSVKGFHAEESLAPPKFFLPEVSWKSCSLTPQEIEVKIKALKAHKSQYQSTPKYLLSFIRTNELFGDFPVIKLPANTVALSLPSGKEKTTPPIPEELTDHERASYVGLEWQSLRLEADHFVVSIKLSKPLAEGVGASIYIFGYRFDRPFAQMPKVHIKLGVERYSVYDQAASLPKDSIQVTRKPDEITIQVPLSVLGDPQNILTSARTYIGNVPLDWVSWRVVELTKD